MALNVIEATTIGSGGQPVASTGSPNISAADLNDNHSSFDNITYKTPNNGFGIGSAFDGFGVALGDWTFEKCTSWQRPPHHLYFQLANALFFIAFLAPCESYGSLFARCALVTGSILMIMWSYLIECTFDVFVWSGSFLAVNVIYLIVLIYRLRPIRFEKDIESVSEFSCSQ